MVSRRMIVPGLHSRTLACTVVLVAALAAAAASPPRNQGSTDVPAWLATEWSRLTAGNGVWTTDNSQWRSANEPWDQYATEWKWGIGRKSLTGRLYGIRDGREGATFWQFRIYWQPEKREAIMLQFGGDGTVGEGTTRSIGPDATESIQTFTAPDGSTTQLRHVSTLSDTVHDTQSFDRVDGEWQARRRYIWHHRTTGP
jgi:hypothetical protein